MQPTQGKTNLNEQMKSKSESGQTQPTPGGTNLNEKLKSESEKLI